MLLGRPHVLAKRHDVDVVGTEVYEARRTAEKVSLLFVSTRLASPPRLTLQRLQELVVLLSDTQHQARLGDDSSLGDLLGHPEHLERLAVLSSTVPDGGREALDGLDVVGVDVQAGEGDGSDVRDLAVEVSSKGLDEDLRSPRKEKRSGRRERSETGRDEKVKKRSRSGTNFCLILLMVSAK